MGIVEELISTVRDLHLAVAEGEKREERREWHRVRREGDGGVWV